MKKISFVDLQAQYRSMQSEIQSAFSDVLASMQFIGGSQVDQFESDFAKFLGVKHAISVNSGTDALILGIRALRLSPGDEVIVPVNTFYSTAIAVVENKLKPVFVDCDETYGMSLPDLRRKITHRTKAVIAVHLYGQPDNVDGIMAIIKDSKQKIVFIEDACQAHGATYRSRSVGTFGTFAAFSFYPGKNLGAYGDGGAIVTNSDALAKEYRLLKQYGQTKKYHHITVGINSRLDAIQAAILRKKLQHLSEWNRLRCDHARVYNHCLKGCHSIILPQILHGRRSVFHIYAIRTKRRDQLKAYLSTKGIETHIHYPIPLHRSPAFSYLGYKQGDFPNAELYARQLLSLPMYPELTVHEQE